MGRIVIPRHHGIPRPWRLVYFNCCDVTSAHGAIAVIVESIISTIYFSIGHNSWNRKYSLLVSMVMLLLFPNEILPVETTELSPLAAMILFSTSNSDFRESNRSVMVSFVRRNRFLWGCEFFFRLIIPQFEIDTTSNLRNSARFYFSAHHFH